MEIIAVADDGLRIAAFALHCQRRTSTGRLSANAGRERDPEIGLRATTERRAFAVDLLQIQRRPISDTILDCGQGDSGAAITEGSPLFGDQPSTSAMLEVFVFGVYAKLGDLPTVRT